MNTHDGQFQERMSRIEGLIQQIESFPDANIQSTTRELVQSLLDLHGAGLERILELARHGSSSTLINDMTCDELVSSLLLLHNLHPVDLAARVETALKKVRPQLALHSGNVELLDIDDGVVHLKLEGNCHGCASSRVTLRYTIEEAIYAAAPDIAGIEVEGAEPEHPAPSGGFVPLVQLSGSNV